MKTLVWILLQVLLYMVIAGIAWQWVLGLEFSIAKLFCISVLHAVLGLIVMRTHQLTFNTTTPKEG